MEEMSVFPVRNENTAYADYFVGKSYLNMLSTEHIERMAENLDIWDFTLTDDEMAKINALDIGRSEIVDHFSTQTAKWLNGWKIHD